MSAGMVGGNGAGGEADETFNPFLAEPLLLGRLQVRTSGREEWARGVESQPKGLTPLMVGALSLVVGLLSILTVNLLQGTVGSFRWAQLEADLRAAWSGELSASSKSADFPMLRDLPTMLAAIIAFLTPAIIVRQWVAMRGYVQDLFSGGVLFDSTVSTSTFREWISHENTRLRQCGHATPLILVGAIACSLLITRTQSSIGVFAALTGPDEAAQAAYRGWWASSETAYAGYILYVAVTTLFLYLVFVQNLVGLRLVRFMWLKRQYLNVGYDVHNRDGAYGWMPMRRLLSTVYVSLAVHAVALVVLAFTTQADAFINWLLPLALLYLFVFPLYTFLPLWLFGYRRRLTKREDISRICATLGQLESEIHERRVTGEPTGDRFSEHELHRWRLSLVEKVPLTPFRTRTMVAGVVLYLIPAAAAILQSFDILTK